MEYRRLGASGLRVPALSFGTATFGGSGDFFKAWGSTDAGGAERLIDVCLENGVSMFDSADVYSDGRNGPETLRSFLASNSGDRMAEVVLFHHALGLTPGVTAFARELRGAGHTVHTPDLFAGRTFATLDAGVRQAEQIGFSKILERGVRAVQALPAELIYAGFSLGVLPAQKLAQTRAGARGALLFYSCVPVSEFGSAWPAGVPVQVHGMDADPIFVGEGDVDAARALVRSTDDAELFLYRGSEHYFADSTLPSYDADAAGLVLQRTLTFLRSRD